MLTILSKEEDQERVHGGLGRDISGTWVCSSGPIPSGAEHQIPRGGKIESTVWKGGAQRGMNERLHW